jgi:SAM-dependent methyltransferase/DNA-binding transcriptional ArsR family regulator
MKLQFERALGVLRAAAESTRLRLLALLRHGELTVGEITAVLGQSQPRVSRHLKLLCDMDLLDRFREEHFVYYRVPATGSGADLASQVLALVDPADGVFRLDRERMSLIVANRAKAAESAGSAVDEVRGPLALDRMTGRMAEPEQGAERNRSAPMRDAHPDDRPGDANLDFAAAVAAVLGEEPLGDLLDIGTGSGSLLRLLAGRATQAVGLDISSEALRRARSQVHGSGLSHCVFRRGDMHNLPFAQPEFDTIVIDRALAHTDRPVGVLREAARTLRTGGRLLLIDDYDRLTELGGNPLTEIRRWLTAAGLEVGRLCPLDTPDAHLLLAECRRGRRKIAA